MKKTNHRWLVVLVLLMIVAVSCSSERRVSGGSGKNCGCGLHKGYVGY
jgi:hypothetical protein